MKKKITIKDLIQLQMVIILYSTTSIIAKFTANQELLSFRFIGLAMIEVVVLGIYAILWQQMIKKFDLSIAYANRAMELFWSMVWMVFIFHNQITLPKVVGILLVMIGTFVINSDQKEEEKEIHA